MKRPLGESIKAAAWWTLGLVFQNFGWKLLSLAIAVAIWALVASEPELSTFTPVQLTYKNVPDDLEISLEPLTTLTLELRGPSFALRGLGTSGNRPAVVLDLSGARTGPHTYTVGGDNVQLPRGVRLVRAIPSQVRFDFEPRLSINVPVVARFAGEGHDGYHVAHCTISPPTLRIAGPASHVRRIQQAVTDPVNVASVVGSSQFRVNASVDDPYVRFESSPQVAVKVVMSKH